MSMTYGQVIAIRDALKPGMEDYHSSRKKLRQFWHGRYWEDVDTKSNNVSSVFRDLTSRTSDVGPDIKLVYNLLKDVCVKYQSFLSPLPMIRCYTDPPASTTRKNQATLKERYLYGLWSENNANKVVGNKAWYLPLMGDAFLGIHPDMEKNICRMSVRSPEHAFPLPKWDPDLDGNDGIIFSWKTTMSAAKRAYPQWSGVTAAPATGRRRSSAPADPMVEIVEFYDDDCFYRWIEGSQVNGIEHNFGFNLWEHVKFINVPGEVMGHGAVEQSVNLVEMGNVYLSLMMQSAIENVFPVMVLEDAMKAPETIERGAGAVIPVNAGGKVYYLTPPAGNLLAQGEWAKSVEQMVKTDTSMPDVNFGQADQSIVTGKAINELQGAGTGSLVEMVQGVGIGAALVAWNEKAITIGRTMFKDDQIRLFGQEAGSLAETNPRNFSMNIKGSQLVGSTRNEVVFMPYLDMHTKVVIGLQMAGAGLVSKKWQRENTGIPDSDAMDEEIVGEAIQDAALTLIVQAITDPTAMQPAEDQAISIIEGHPLLSMREPPMPGTPPSVPPGSSAPPGGPPIGTLPGGGQVMSPAMQQPPGAPPPEGSQPPQQRPNANTATGAGNGVPLDHAITAFSQLQVNGKVFLVGEIVQRGITADPVEVRITDASDRDTVSQVPFPVVVRAISTDIPGEPYVEVTPGATNTIQGEEPSPADIGMA